MKAFDWAYVVVVGFGLFVLLPIMLPVLAYVCVRMGTIGFYYGRAAYRRQARSTKGRFQHGK